MALTDRSIQNLKTTGKPHKHFDGGGLHIHVSPTGGKLWRLSYRHNGKAKLLSFGAYPAVTLKMARDRRDEAKSLLARGIDPAEHKKELKKLSVALTENTFEAVGREWHAKNRDMWEKKRAKAILSHLEKNVFPFIGKMPIAAIKAPDLLAVARRIEERGAMYYSHAVMQTCGRVFRYGIDGFDLDRFDAEMGAVLDEAVAFFKSDERIVDSKNGCMRIPPSFALFQTYLPMVARVLEEKGKDPGFAGNIFCRAMHRSLAVNLDGDIIRCQNGNRVVCDSVLPLDEIDRECGKVLAERRIVNCPGCEYQHLCGGHCQIHPVGTEDPGRYTRFCAPIKILIKHLLRFVELYMEEDAHGDAA